MLVYTHDRTNFLRLLQPSLFFKKVSACMCIQDRKIQIQLLNRTTYKSFYYKSFSSQNIAVGQIILSAQLTIYNNMYVYLHVQVYRHRKNTEKQWTSAKTLDWKEQSVWDCSLTILYIAKAPGANSSSSLHLYFHCFT